MTVRPKSLLLVAFLICVLAALLLAAYSWNLYTRPASNAQAVVIYIPDGAGVNQILHTINEHRLIRHPSLVKIVMRLTGADKNLKAGEYEIPPHASAHEIMDLLHEGETLDRFFTAIDGETAYQTVMRLQDTEYLSGAIETIPPEGSLLPETYQYKRGEARQEILNRMQAAMTEALETAWNNRSPGLPIDSPAEAVTLAAIVEKETAIAAERPRIAAVFLNRLDKNMRLQADPTVIYGITKGRAALGRRLLIKDLEADHEYNTYTRRGLPAGPIANPSVASLTAVLNPITTSELYFVADGTGGHVFAATLAEHNANVAKWRKFRREQGF